MPIILNKQSRFVTIPYIDANGHRKEVRLFGYTLDLTQEQFDAVCAHPLTQEWFANGDFAVVRDSEINSFQIVNNAPIANGSQGSFPVSSVTDPKVNDKLYKSIEKEQKGDSEVPVEKVIEKTEPKAPLTRGNTKN